MGGLEVSKVVDDHEGWRLLSCMWLHGRVFHLLDNMLSLLAIGIRLELEFGFVRIGLLYVISGFGGSLLSSLFIQSNISVGPSGALFGLLGAMLSELITNWRIYANKAAALITLVVIIAINLAVGILPNVDNFARLGGFITGFLLGFVLLIRPQFGWISQRHLQHYTPSPTSKFKIYQRGLWVISLILLLVWLIAALVMVLSGVDLNDNCSWCHYLSTFPLQRERSDQPLNFWALLHFFLYSSDAAPVVLNNVKLPVVLSCFAPISDKNKTVKRMRDSHGGAAAATAPKSNNVPQQSEKPVTSDEAVLPQTF